METYIELQNRITDYFLEKPNWIKKLQPRYEFVYQMLKDHINKSLPLIDIGGRDGACLRYFAEKGFSNLWLLDLSHNAIRKANCHGCVSDAHAISLKDDLFYSAICLHTLEHCYDPGRVLIEIYRILKANGVCILMLPIEEGKRVPTYWGHYSFFPDENSLSQLLSGLFEKIQIKTDMHQSTYLLRSLKSESFRHYCE
jgi:ubiquinone/menaquinone biosynthesis C-methylase UbiE